jgi:hypothetical protein
MVHRNLKGRDPLENLGTDGRIILECILDNRMGRCGLDLSGSEQKPEVGSCGHHNELLGSIKGKEFLD